VRHANNSHISRHCITLCWLAQVESGRSGSVASHGSLQSSEDACGAAGAISGPSRPADNNDVTSFSIRRPVCHHSCLGVCLSTNQPTDCGWQEHLHNELCQVRL